MKNVQIRSCFWSAFSCFWTEYKKIRTRKNSTFGHFSRSVLINWFLMKNAILKTEKSSNQAENKQICPLVSISLTNCCFFIAIPIWQSHHFRVCRLLWKCYKSQVLFCGWFLLNLKFLSSCIEKSSVLAYDIISTGTVQFYSTVNDVLNK